MVVVLNIIQIIAYIITILALVVISINITLFTKNNIKNDKKNNIEVDSLTFAELRAKAKELKINNYYRLTKNELIQAIKKNGVK